MPNLQRRKTQMVGTLVVPNETMTKTSHHEPTAPASPTRSNVVRDAMEHFGQDLQRSVNLQKRKTEMYGTLIVNAMDESTNSGSFHNSPSTSSPGRMTKKWNEPMDEVSAF